MIEFFAIATLAGWAVAIYYARKWQQAHVQSACVASENMYLRETVEELHATLAKAQPMTFHMCGVDQSFHPADPVSTNDGRDIVVWRN